LQKDAEQTERFIESLTRIQHLRINPPAIGKLSSKDVCLLLFIFHHSIKMPGGITVSFVSDSLGVTRSLITQQTNRLLQLGYITKQSDTADRRSVRIVLTDTGLALVKIMDKNRENFASELVDYLGADDSGEFIRLLDKISEFLVLQKKCGGSK